jgi:hypothetical protein
MKPSTSPSTDQMPPALRLPADHPPNIWDYNLACTADSLFAEGTLLSHAASHQWVINCKEVCYDNVRYSQPLFP